MKRTFVLLLVLVFSLAMFAGCGGSDPAPAPPPVTDSGNGDVDEGEPADGDKVSYEIYGVTVTAVLPAEGWDHTGDIMEARYYNIPDASKANSGDPRIIVSVRDNAEIFDKDIDDFEDLIETMGFNIGGADMKGRAYTVYGMQWLEFIGAVNDTHYASVKISGVNVGEGEGKAVLDSIAFK
jgi:hypothetical protein